MLLLCVVGCVDAGAVLGSRVVSLAHALGGIVGLPKEAEECLERDVKGIKDDENNFVVAGHTGADFVVGGVGCDPCGVANSGGVDALLCPELSLSAPKAAHSKDDLLCIGWKGRFDGRLKDKVCL